jgi:hypothetical protein
MNVKFALVVAALAVTPVLAQAQQKPAKTTVADVQKVVQAITADKAKAQAYCDMAKLEDEIGAAEEKRDTKKVEELSKKADQLAEKLGADYAKVVAGLEEIDPDSPEGRAINAAFEPLEKLCPGVPSGR